MTAKPKLYIQMFSIHGLVRSTNLELGRDADTGGQITYVLELARHISRLDAVEGVDLVTRLVSDKKVSEDYGQTVEKVDEKCRIVRIQCGGRKYIRKELLWPHLDEFIDKTVKFIRREGRIPDVFHGHYADGGYVAMELSSFFGSPFVFTGHSLGRVKHGRLLNDGVKEKDIQKRYKIAHRIEVEEEILKSADLIVASTRQEVEEQYGQYHNGRVPRFVVLPPGLDVDRFYPYYHDLLPEKEKPEEAVHARASMMQELNRFFMQPEKPLLLALCRPDKRKNISGLIRAYGEDLELRTMANLAVFAGIRKDIEVMEENERDVLTRMLLLMDKYDLYGRMAIPKRHDFDLEVPELYRIAAEKRGVFVNPALTEPFGLTLLEASACGLPIVATNDGGPKDIIANCANGVLVDPSDPAQIAEAVRGILSDRERWEAFSKSGVMKVREHYTWDSHAKAYLEALSGLMKGLKATALGRVSPTDAIGRRLTRLQAFLVTDIDDTLVGGDPGPLEALLAFLRKARGAVGFGVATGRTVSSAVECLREHGIDPPDVVISSVGTEIYYGKKLKFSKSWETHLSHKWHRDEVRRVLDRLPYLTYQEEDTQRPFKVSYFMKPAKDRLAEIHDALLQHRLKYNLIYSQGRYLDILPYRASKGKAIRFLSYKWEIPLGNILVCGDSGNDEEMLRGVTMGVVVGNHSPDLESLKGIRNIFFAKGGHAAGILEGISRYGFEKWAEKRDE